MKLLSKTRIFLLASLIVAAFSIRAVMAYDSIDAAFAEFIKAVYDNTQTASGANGFCVYGSDAISTIIQTSGHKNFIALPDSMRSPKKCRIVYIARDKERYVRSFIGGFNKSGALTIAVFDTFTQDGGMISVGVGRRNFELTANSDEFKKSSVRIDSEITGLIVGKR